VPHSARGSKSKLTKLVGGGFKFYYGKNYNEFKNSFHKFILLTDKGKNMIGVIHKDLLENLRALSFIHFENKEYQIKI